MTTALLLIGGLIISLFGFGCILESGERDRLARLGYFALGCVGMSIGLTMIIAALIRMTMYFVSWS